MYIFGLKEPLELTGLRDERDALPAPRDREPEVLDLSSAVSFSVRGGMYLCLQTPVDYKINDRIHYKKGFRGPVARLQALQSQGCGFQSPKLAKDYTMTRISVVI